MYLTKLQWTGTQSTPTPILKLLKEVFALPTYLSKEAVLFIPWPYCNSLKICSSPPSYATNDFLYSSLNTSGSRGMVVFVSGSSITTGSPDDYPTPTPNAWVIFAGTLLPYSEDSRCTGGVEAAAGALIIPAIDIATISLLGVCSTELSIELRCSHIALLMPLNW